MRYLQSSLSQLGHAVTLGGGDPGRVTVSPGHPNPVQPVGRRGRHRGRIASNMRGSDGGRLPARRRPVPALPARSRRIHTAVGIGPNSGADLGKCRAHRRSPRALLSGPIRSSLTGGVAQAGGGLRRAPRTWRCDLPTWWVRRRRFWPPTTPWAGRLQTCPGDRQTTPGRWPWRPRVLGRAPPSGRRPLGRGGQSRSHHWRKPRDLTAFLALAVLVRENGITVAKATSASWSGCSEGRSVSSVTIRPYATRIAVTCRAATKGQH